MNKYLSLDISNSTGWCYFEDYTLKDHGVVTIPTSMELPQRISYFSAQITILLERYKPSWVFIEDLILGISGVSVLSYLARLNGVAIYICSKYVNNNLKLYGPTYWKSHSFEGLDSMAKKWEIQLAVIKHFKMNFNITDEELLHFSNRKKECEDTIAMDNLTVAETRKELLSLSSAVVRKRNPLTPLEIDQAKNKITELKKLIDTKKQSKKYIEKEIDKRMAKVSNELAAKSGLGTDAADSVGICWCGIKEVEQIIK
jgi:Holliday junction resolvasome RuvABC endonuclease subunit